MKVEEVDSYINDYSSVMEYGEKVTADPSTFNDPQYMSLRERLNALKDGWKESNQTREKRQYLLSQSPNLQMFYGNGDKVNGVLFFGDRPLSEISFNLLEILSVGKCFPHIISWKTKLDLLCDLKPVMTDKDKYRIEIKYCFVQK